MKAIDKGMLSSSIDLHLFLEIGNVYEQTAVFNIRYAYNKDNKDNCK